MCYERGMTDFCDKILSQKLIIVPMKSLRSNINYSFSLYTFYYSFNSGVVAVTIAKSCRMLGYIGFAMMGAVRQRLLFQLLPVEQACLVSFLVSQPQMILLYFGNQKKCNTFERKASPTIVPFDRCLPPGTSSNIAYYPSETT